MKLRIILIMALAVLVLLSGCSQSNAIGDDDIGTTGGISTGNKTETVSLKGASFQIEFPSNWKANAGGYMGTEGGFIVTEIPQMPTCKEETDYGTCMQTMIWVNWLKLNIPNCNRATITTSPVSGSKQLIIGYPELDNDIMISCTIIDHSKSEEVCGNIMNSIKC